MLHPVVSGLHQRQVPCVAASSDVPELQLAQVGTWVSVVLDTERAIPDTEAVVAVLEPPRICHSAIRIVVARRRSHG